MNTIKNFEKYVNENILFPRGGNIGGEHKKSVTDEEIESGKARKKGYQPQPKGITNAALNIENEKRSQRKINLMGSELNGYNEKNRVENVINSVEYYKKFIALSPVNENYETVVQKLAKLENSDMEEDEGLLGKLMNLFAKR